MQHNPMHPPAALVRAMCQNCGAPDDGEFVQCSFCHSPVSLQAAQYAIPCPNPQCRTACRWGKNQCGRCRMWLVVSCIFCGALSPHNQSNCMACQEAFHGAAERKAMRMRQMNHRENMQIVAAVAPAAGYAAGEIGGAVLFGVIGAMLDD